MGYVYIFLAATCWGLLGPISRIAFDSGVAPFEVAFWRAILGGILFVAHLGLIKSSNSSRIAFRDIPAIFLFGFIGVAVFYGGYQMAVDTGGAALASILLYTAPAWVAVMSALWFSERITGAKVIAIVLTLTGVIGLAAGGSGETALSFASLLWGLLSGFCYALYYPFGRIYFRKYEPVLIYAIALPIGAVLLFPFVDFAAKDVIAWLAIGAVGFISTYLAYLAYGKALQHLEPARASILAALEPVVAGALAYWWWAEQFSMLGYAGAALVLAGVYIALRTRARSPSEIASYQQE